MYAVIATGGKQYRVGVGDTLDVERVNVAEDGTVALTPIMLVADDGAVTTGKDELADVRVQASLVEEYRGPKVTVFKYKNKTGYRRKAGHRQSLARIRVDDITA
jgi:large subunit ribosomal protein L21